MSFAGLHHHGVMLSDRARNAILADAISSVVKLGDIVVDVGSGTGFLALLAARAGASQVYALERGPIAEIARDLVARNGYQNVVRVERTASFDWEPPELADVLLCETLGFAALEEGFRRTMADAHRRMLKVGGQVIPRLVRILAAPVTPGDQLIEARYIDHLGGFDFTSLGKIYEKVPQRDWVPLTAQCGASEILFELDSAALAPYASLTTQKMFSLDSVTSVGAFVLWFEADLADGAVLSSRNPARSNHWAQTILPLPKPVVGDRILLSVEIDDRVGFRIEWNASTLPEVVA